jgi:hypothetical protein
MKKDRPDSFEAKLQRNQLDALERWLFDDTPTLTYEQAKDRVWQDFSVRVSESALRRFHRRCSQRRLEESIIERAQAANSVLDKVEKNPADMYRAVLSLVSHIAFENASQDLDPEVLYNFTKLMIAAKKEETRDQALALEKEKFQRETCKLFVKWSEDQRAKSILAGSESNATKIEQLGELMFGDLWKK